MRELRIGDRRIADDEPCYTICDISHNHLGSVGMAAEMIRLAAGAGADAVKFQKRGASTYQGLRAIGEVEYATTRESRELSVIAYQTLRAVATTCGVHFLVTVFDIESAEEMLDVGLDAVKLASGDLTNGPLLRHVARMGLPIIISSGAADIEDVKCAVYLLTSMGAEFGLLHCTSEYPVAADHVNLRVIEDYRERFPETVIGFSSHVRRQWGPALEAAAYTLGARIIEKHLTLTPDIGTGEHGFGLTITDLHDLVRTMGLMRQAVGCGRKVICAEEWLGGRRLGKHLVWAGCHSASEAVCSHDIAVIGGGVGIGPNRLHELVGATLARTVADGEPVRPDDVFGGLE